MITEAYTLKNGYKFLENNQIQFIFDLSNFDEKNLKSIKNSSVFIAGTFNSWNFKCDKNWELQPANPTTYILTKDLSEVTIPGNSGYPEFRFYTKNRDKTVIFAEKRDEPSFQDNNVILQTQEEYDILQPLVKKLKIKTKKDFDLSLLEDRRKISNVRLVPGTKVLYRGYHPYKKSRPELDTENIRLKLVKEAFEELNINCDITLCGKEKPNFWKGEKKSSRMKSIEKKNNRLWVDIEYNLVYYNPDSEEFGKVLQEIGRFFIEKDGPFYIHCRLGSDRTGVISSIFASLVGATWEEIATDYEKTANMGTGEVRNSEFLAFSLTKMIKKSPKVSENLSADFRKYFVDKGILSETELDKLVAKLKG